MESNSLIIGRIPGSGEGIRKTYEESMFVDLWKESVLTDTRLNRREKVYINKETNEIIYESHLPNDKTNCKELDVLALIPYTRNGSSYCLCEVIEKDILHKHLMEERLLAEEQLNLLRQIANSLESNKGKEMTL